IRRVDERAEVRVRCGVVDGAVDAAEPVERAREQRLDVLGLAGVAGNRDRAIRWQRARHAIEIRLLARREHDLRAGFDAGARDRFTDAAARSGDDDDLVLEHAAIYQPWPLLVRLVYDVAMGKTPARKRKGSTKRAYGFDQYADRLCEAAVK